MKFNIYKLIDTIVTVCIFIGFKNNIKSKMAGIITQSTKKSIQE